MRVVQAIPKLFFLAYILFRLTAKPTAGYLDVLLLLVIAAVQTFKERFSPGRWINYAAVLVIGAASMYDPIFAVLFCVVLYDMVLVKDHWALLLPAAGLIYFLHPGPHFPLYLLIAPLSGWAAYVLLQLKTKTEASRQYADAERRLRYALEQTKTRLVRSSEEAARLAETTERNRIAREIHDHAGHKLAAVLIQLQAALTLREKNPDKFQSMMDRAVQGLSEAMDLIRDTVHRLKPAQKTGVEYLQEVMRNFSFCPVDFSFTGDFGRVSSVQMEILATNIKEALTNASKHSQATHIVIRVDIRQPYLRLYIKDNGEGSKTIREGLGLSGMRERVKAAGGSFSADGTEGFVIVCLLPMEEGVSFLEHINRG